MGTNCTFLRYATLFSRRLGDGPPPSLLVGNPNSKCFQHQAFQTTWARENYTGQGAGPQKKRFHYRPWNRTDSHVDFQSEMSQGSFHPSVFLENTVTNSGALLPATLSVIESRTYDQAAIILNLLWLNMTKHLFNWNHVIAKIILISIQSPADDKGSKSQDSCRNWKDLGALHIFYTQPQIA